MQCEAIKLQYCNVTFNSTSLGELLSHNLQPENHEAKLLMDWLKMHVSRLVIFWWRIYASEVIKIQLLAAHQNIYGYRQRHSIRHKGIVGPS